MTVISKVADSKRDSLLYDLATLRGNILAAQNEIAVSARVTAWSEAARSWVRLPSLGQRWYSSDLFDALFELQECVEEEESDFYERAVVELSLWDVAVMIGLARCDAQANRFITGRRERLLRLIIDKGGERQALCASFALVLRHRTVPIRTLPGDYQTDVGILVGNLSAKGMPRRAKAIADRFKMQLGAVGEFAMRHRSAEDEEYRARGFVRALTERVPILPLSILKALPAIRCVLSAEFRKLPVVVDKLGRIDIGGQTFGVTSRRY